MINKKSVLIVCAIIAIIVLGVSTLVYGYFYFAYDYANIVIKSVNYDGLDEFEFDEQGITETGEKASDYYALLLYNDKPDGYPNMKNKFTVESVSLGAISFKIDSNLVFRDDNNEIVSEYSGTRILNLKLVDFKWRIDSVQ